MTLGALRALRRAEVSGAGRRRARRRRRPALGRARRPAADDARPAGPADGADGDAARARAHRRPPRRAAPHRPAARAARAQLVRQSVERRTAAPDGQASASSRVSDGRASVHRDVGAFAPGVEDRIAARARGARRTRVVRAHEVVWTNELAVAEARRLADARPDLTIVNIPVWAFPHFTMLAARELPGPLLLFSNVDPQYPGMVGHARGRRGARPDRPRRTGAPGATIDGSPACSSAIEAHIRAGAAASVPPRLDVRPHRRAADGHVHGRLERRPVDAPVRRRRRGDRPVGARPALRDGRRRPASRLAASGSSGTPRASTTTASASRPSCSSARSARTTRCAS